MATKKFLDSTGISSLWLKVMQEFSNVNHKHDDSYLSLGGGTVNGDITANKFVTSGATADSAVLGDGSALDVSALQVSATDKLPERFLWRNRFDGTEDLSGDIMIQTGLTIDGSGDNTYIGFGNDPEQNITIGSAKISDTAFKYKDGDVLHKGNFTYNGTDSTIYAPTSAGDVNDILASAGTGAPAWNKPADISVGTVLTTVESDVTGTTQATEDSTTKIATTEFVHNAASTGIATLTNALIYKGTIGTGGTVEALPENYSVGDTYKVITPGTYAGHVCEVGDMIVAIEGGWTVVQNNTDIATSSVTGMVKGGTTVESEKIYGINVSGAGEMTVSVPWDDTTGLAEDEVMDLIENILHPKDYLAFTALEDGTFSFVKNGNPKGSVSYSLDNGSSWTALNYGSSTPTVTAGSKILWKGDYRGTYYSNYATFSSTSKFNVSGNIMSLMFEDDIEGKTDLTGYNYCFYQLFRNCSNLVDASNLVLPATKLVSYCYSIMFSGCTSLTAAPELPATTLAQSCYQSMFANCTSLTTAPELPATTLAQSCYSSIFNGCTSLTAAPELPATKLADYCYEAMFKNCSSLTTAPELPATTLAQRCYQNMFENCSSLTTTPELPATTLAKDCYDEMFSNCSSLTTAPELPATTLANYCYYKMFENCTSLTSAPELPVTTLAESCYLGMFENCSSLTTAPELSATTLAQSCYNSMFKNCTSLTAAPELPVTTLADYCYAYMFQGCTSLTTAPELPATTLAPGCYRDMFHSCTSLTTAPELPAMTLAVQCYVYMFQGCTSLTTAPKTLPATTLANYCYQSMFSNCSSLTTAPELPATTLATSCYSEMFSNCSSLTTAPELPATTLANYCYQSMFSYCTSLTTAPELPATKLVDNCYWCMFQGCRSLTTAPQILPATTLASKCCSYMFENCSSLTTAPELPATKLVDDCYYYMFSGCSKLNYIKAMFTTTPSGPYTSSWVFGVSKTGTFVKNAAATWNVTGNSGIPAGWTVETATA